MSAYNAALKMIYDEIMAQEIAALVILVHGASSDETSAVTGKRPETIVHFPVAASNP